MNQQVNLFHPIFRRQEKKFSAATMLQAAALVLIGILLMYGYALWRNRLSLIQLRDVNVQQAAAMARLNDVSIKLPIRHADPRLEKEVNDLERRIEAVQRIRSIAKGDLFKGGTGYSGYLMALARQSTNGLWLTGLTISGAGEQMMLAGRSVSPENVPRYLQRLAREPALSGMQFEIFQMKRPVLKPADPEKKTDAVLEPYVDFVVRTTPAEKPK